MKLKYKLIKHSALLIFIITLVAVPSFAMTIRFLSNPVIVQTSTDIPLDLEITSAIIDQKGSIELTSPTQVDVPLWYGGEGLMLELATENLGGGRITEESVMEITISGNNITADDFYTTCSIMWDDDPTMYSCNDNGEIVDGNLVFRSEAFYVDSLDTGIGSSTIIAHAYLNPDTYNIKIQIVQSSV